MSHKIEELLKELCLLQEKHDEEYCRKLFEIIVTYRVESHNINHVLQVLRSQFPEIILSVKLFSEKYKRESRWP